MSSRLHKTRVAFSVTNCICHDQRVLKIAETVSKSGGEITIIGRRSGYCCNSDTVPFKTRRFRMIFKKGFLFYKCFNIRLLFYLLFHKYDVLVANDLDTLLPNFIVSRLKRIQLVYDSHEYFTGVAEIQNKPFIKWVWKTIEKMIFPHLKYVMTVSDSIAVKYENEYGIRPVTVRNCSNLSTGINSYSREVIHVDRKHLLLILQGTGINVDRGGEELIEAIRMTENVSLLVIGSGDVLPVLREKVRSFGISDRVIFIPKLPWLELMRYTKSADAGLSLDKDTNLNSHFSLPNKLFDYISAGIPVIASNLHEVRKIVEIASCGIIITSVTPDNIRNAIQELRDNSDYLKRLKQNTVIASKKMTWEAESKIVTDFYRMVLNRD
jgi:glycosyltransferase involved in cell wall biosynthesis